MARQTNLQAKRRLNDRVDAALAADHADGLLELLDSNMAVTEVAERIRRRATRLARLQGGSRETIIRHRDHLTRVIYAAATHTPLVAWVDASLAPGHNGAGIGVVLADHSGNVQACAELHGAAREAVSAEMEAVVGAVELALACQWDSLTVYSDCFALVQLWRKARRDPRLDGLRHAVARLRRFRLHAIRRAHNQPAHRHARHALSNAAPAPISPSAPV